MYDYLPGCPFFPLYVLILSSALSTAASENLCRNTMKIEIARREAHQALVERGVHFETGPMLIAPMATYDLWLAEFRDSENNVLALMCEKSKADS